MNNRCISVISLFVYSIIAFSYSLAQEENTSIEKLQYLRSEIPKNIQVQLEDRLLEQKGRCGFVNTIDSDRQVTTLDIQDWKLENPQTRNLSIPIAVRVAPLSGSDMSINRSSKSSTSITT